jgi:hypothetical protein
MATYNDLYPASYYLIKENENAGIELVYIPMVTGKCVLIEYQDDDQTMKWFKKTDPIYELVEQLTEEQAVIYESLFENEEEDNDDLPWETEDDDSDNWFDVDEDDTDEDDKVKAINN